MRVAILLAKAALSACARQAALFIAKHMRPTCGSSRACADRVLELPRSRSTCDGQGGARRPPRRAEPPDLWRRPEDVTDYYKIRCRTCTRRSARAPSRGGGDVARQGADAAVAALISSNLAARPHHRPARCRQSRSCAQKKVIFSRRCFAPYP